MWKPCASAKTAHGRCTAPSSTRTPLLTPSRKKSSANGAITNITSLPLPVSARMSPARTTCLRGYSILFLQNGLNMLSYKRDGPYSPVEAGNAENSCRLWSIRKDGGKQPSKDSDAIAVHPARQAAESPDVPAGSLRSEIAGVERQGYNPARMAFAPAR